MAPSKHKSTSNPPVIPSALITPAKPATRQPTTAKDMTVSRLELGRDNCVDNVQAIASLAALVPSVPQMGHATVEVIRPPTGSMSKA